MSRTQKRPLAPPSEADSENKLKDFTQVIQESLEDLFEFSHTHDHLTDVPADTDGQVGDIKIVTVAGSRYLYAKTPDGWFRTALS
jgi:hypothetical protein